MRISVHMVRAVVSAAERSGSTRDALSARIGDLPQFLERHDAWLPVADFKGLIEAALELTNDPQLGLHLGEHATATMFQLLAHLVQHASTLGEALDMIARYTGLLAQGFEPLVIVTPERALLRFPFLHGDSQSVRVMAELAMAGCIRLLQQYVGERALPERVCFAYAKPADADEYLRVFRGKERFSQAFTELQFPAAWLTYAQLHKNPELHVVLRTHADGQLARLQRGGSMTTRVEQLLGAHDPRTLPSMPGAARMLGISCRTLGRKLQSEGSSFAALLSERRVRAAQHLIEMRLSSVREVAEAMGFSDACAFHKAFKRWTGLTPMRYSASLSSRRGVPR